MIYKHTIYFSVKVKFKILNIHNIYTILIYTIYFSVKVKFKILNLKTLKILCKFSSVMD